MPAHSVRMPGLLLSDHTVAVPLDHGRPDGEHIEVFAREVVAPRKRDDDLPWLVFLQGGPGSSAPRPTSRAGWLGTALEHYRVLLLDQRGTGRSTPATRQTLAGRSATDAAAYLGHFRADAIVRDAEALRHRVAGGAPWTVLGQSFGGFCALTYLSLAPEGLRDVLVTGGVPPVGRAADDVYGATFERARDRNRRYAERYPDDVTALGEVADVLADAEARGEPVRLPGGDPLSVRRLQTIGHAFGMSDGLDVVHYVVELAWADRGRRVLSDVFLAGVERLTAYLENPLYHLLHEAVYVDGPGGSSSWSAQRVRAQHRDFDPDARPLLLTGEMVFPWQLDEYAALRPLREAGHLLAERDDWPRLYDEERLASNEVPVAAAVYADDMYVESAFSLEVARRVPHLRAWVTNEFEHDGLRTETRVLGRLLDMVAGDA